MSNYKKRDQLLSSWHQVGEPLPEAKELRELMDNYTKLLIDHDALVEKLNNIRKVLPSEELHVFYQDFEAIQNMITTIRKELENTQEEQK